MQKITPCLWFDDDAEAAVEFYTSLFKNSRINKIARYGKDGAAVSGRPEGSVMTIAFQLEGQDFIALNGGPMFKFNEAISLSVDCQSQQEVDELWEQLSAGGQKGQCGWLKDRFGLSWQIVPSALVEMLQDEDGERSQRVMQALLQMTKLDIAALRRAYEGK
jgi:predicted 3-demethylubiquinone-9 3-methyltransferase (glyoxalase superfamily)